MRHLTLPLGCCMFTFLIDSLFECGQRVACVELPNVILKFQHLYNSRPAARLLQDTC